MNRGFVVIINYILSRDFFISLFIYYKIFLNNEFQIVYMLVFVKL